MSPGKGVGFPFFGYESRRRTGYPMLNLGPKRANHFPGSPRLKYQLKDTYERVFVSSLHKPALSRLEAKFVPKLRVEVEHRGVLRHIVTDVEEPVSKISQRGCNQVKCVIERVPASREPEGSCRRRCKTLQRGDLSHVSFD